MSIRGCRNRFAGAALALSLATLATSAWPAAESCANFQIVDDGIPLPLASAPPDPVRGAAIAASRSLGDCVACHRLPLPDRQRHGTLGPDLDTVGARLTAAQLRLRIAAPRRLNPVSLMPAYCTVGGTHRVSLGFLGRPMLDAGQIEDVIAWLIQLDGTTASPRREVQ